MSKAVNIKTPGYHEPDQAPPGQPPAKPVIKRRPMDSEIQCMAKLDAIMADFDLTETQQLIVWQWFTAKFTPAKAAAPTDTNV